MDKSKSTLIISAVILFSLFNQYLFANELQSEKFLLENKLLINDRGDYIVDITLINLSGDNVNIYLADLPWARNENFIKSIIVGGSKIPLYSALINFSSNHIELADQEKLTGEIALSDSLLDSSILKNDEFIVFWSYEVRSTDGQVLDEISGKLHKSDINKLIKNK